MFIQQIIPFCIIDETVLEWKTASSESWSARGVFGFTVFDENDHIVAQRNPMQTNWGASGFISVNNIETIKFETNSPDGFLGLISVKMGIFGGFLSDVWQQQVLPNPVFHCIDCIASSSSTELGSLYLDTDMNEPQDLPGTANCQNTCTFRKIHAPPPGKINPRSDKTKL